MGIDINLVNEDTLQIKGADVKGGDFFSHNDHRIAMAGALLGLNSEKPIRIRGSESVKKSYPHFFEDLKKLNLQLKQEN